MMVYFGSDVVRCTNFWEGSLALVFIIGFSFEVDLDARLDFFLLAEIEFVLADFSALAKAEVWKFDMSLRINQDIVGF